MPRPKSMIERFMVSTLEEPTVWLTIEAALTAATERSLALYIAGDTWSVGNTMVQWENKAAGVNIGIFTPSLPPVPGSETVPFDSSWWVEPPSATPGPPPA